MDNITHKGTDFYLNGINYSVLELYEMGLIDNLIAYIEQVLEDHKELKGYLNLTQDKEKLQEFKELLDA